MPARAPLAATRRAALGGALLGLGAATGCDLDPPAKAPSGSGSPASGDPDTALVEEVVAELTRLTGLVTAVAAAYPRLGPRMTDLRDLHVAHRRALGDEPGPVQGSGADLAGTGPEQALRLVSDHERRAQNLLADWSVRAESGALARLLASMSAGVAQRLAVLSSTSAGRAVVGG